MLRKIETLNYPVIGVVAEGKVTREDYETVLIPMLEAEKRRGRKVRFLYHFSPEFSGFTMGAAADDLSVGIKYFHLFEKCAVVTDEDWIRGATQFFGAFMPCPMRAYKNDELPDAVKWLEGAGLESHLKGPELEP